MNEFFNSLVNSIMAKFDGFTDGCRVMMLIDRSKQSTNKGSRRWINKLVSFDKNQFQKNLEKLLDLQLHLNNPSIRLYSCVNKRNIEKSIKYFQHKMIDLSTNEEKQRFFHQLNDNFCSALMQPENKAEKWFLIDLDTTEYDISFACYGIKIVACYNTPNGSHHISEPFNPEILKHIENLEVKKDALILIHALGEK